MRTSAESEGGTYPRRQNDGRRRVVEFRNVEGLREEIRRVELVEGNRPRHLGHRLWRLRRHEVRIGHAHRAELLGHLCDGRAVSLRRNRSGRGSLHLGRVGSIRNGLLVSRSLGLRRIGSIAATAGQLTS